jgi:hypothetical protein
LNIPARIQGGPSCGLVALRVGAEFLLQEKIDKKTGAALLEYAKEQGFTSEGEMFSATELRSVAVEFYGLKEAMVVQPMNVLAIVKNLSCGRPVLVPYDNDKNNRPCNKLGHSAHWATLIGFMCPWDVFASILKVENLLQDREELDLYHTVGNQLTLLECKDQRDFEKYLEDNVKVVAQQSKSRHRGLWSYSELKSSNGNLQVPNPDKLQQHNLHIPSSLNNLQHHMILL